MAGQEQPSTIGIDSSEAWRQVAPEEKFEMMNRAHALGITAAVVSILVMCTIAVAFQASSIMWAGLLLSPLVFQYSAGKAWRDLKPRVMLEYLAARSAARRFAFAEGSKDLHLQLLFRGRIERVVDREDIEEALNQAIKNLNEAETWIALFRDTVVMLHERIGGAALAFGHEINERLTISSDDEGGYTNDKTIMIESRDRMGILTKLRVTSSYPGALAVFEKRVLQLQNEFKKSEALPAVASEFGGEEEAQESFTSFRQ